MIKRILTWGLLFCLAILWLPQQSTFGGELGDGGAGATDQSVLVDPAWLARRLPQSDIRLLEIGMRDHYEKGHIPRAVFVDWIRDITDPALPDRYNVLPRQQLEALLSRIGVGNNTTLVLYDKLENRLSTRMLWTLRLYGHAQVKILDGGAKAWSMSGRPMVTEVPQVQQAEYRVRRIDTDLQASRGLIQSRLNQPTFVLIDGRPVGQYSGQLPGKVYHTGKEHARRGHLPQAVNIPWKANLQADGRFKSVNELRKIYNSAVSVSDTTVVTYCNEGLHAAHPWFVLSELLGHRDVRLYDDSLSEWANTPDEPLVVVYDDP